MQCNHPEIDLSLLDGVLDEYAAIPGSLITILQRAQEIYGYLPPAALELIAERTGVKPAKVYGAATFYSVFRLEPIGKNLILLCQGTACHVNGSKAIEEALTEHLGIADGETTADGLFTLKNVACLGCCSLSPVMMIGEETYGKLTADSVKKILDELRTESDFPKIIEIFPKDFHKCFSFWDFEDNEDKRKKLTEEINSGKRKMFAYLINDEYVGGFSISFKDQEQGYFLSYLTIKEEFRNKGIGSHIIDFSADYVRQTGEKNIYLRVHRDNPSARRLYERKGFTLCDDSVSYRITMIKAL